MNIKELYPKVRTFEITPTDQDGLDQKMYTLQVMLCYDEYKLRLFSHYYNYHITVVKQTGDFIKDLILMDRDELRDRCSLEWKFLYQESVNEVIKSIKRTCRRRHIDINDTQIQEAIDDIKTIDKKYFFGNVEAQINAFHFEKRVKQILEQTPLKKSAESISTHLFADQDFTKDSTTMIVKNLYPILLRELQFDSDEITRDEIRKGLSNYTISLAKDHERNCLLVLIGHERFHVTGIDDSRIHTIIETQEDPEDEIVDLIHQTINSAPIKDPMDDTLWRYFKWVIPNMERVF